MMYFWPNWTTLYILPFQNEFGYGKKICAAFFLTSLKAIKGSPHS